MSVLLFTRNCDETRAMFFIASMPHNQNLIYGNEAHFLVAVLQMKYTVFYLYHSAAKARGSATKNIQSLADHFGQQFLHHYCPNVCSIARSRWLLFMKLSPMLVKIDLKSDSSKLLSFPRSSRKETIDECWQIDLLTTNRVPSDNGISPMRGPISGRLQTQELLLLGPVSLYGLCPTNLSGEPARHRSLPAVATSKALSHGHPRSGVAQHSGPRQLGARLAD